MQTRPLIALSCTISVYDVCSEVIPNNHDAFCEFGACECPLVSKTYSASGLNYQLPTMGGPVFARILEGNFEGNITFFNAISSREYGCLGMKFAIKANV